MKTLLLFLLIVTPFTYVKCLKLELVLNSECSICDQINLKLQLQTTDAANNTIAMAVSSGGIRDHRSLTVDCCNNVKNISITWNRLDTIPMTANRMSCCFSMIFHKGDVKLTMMLNDLFRDKWFCTSEGSIRLSIDSTNDNIMMSDNYQLTVTRLWEEAFNITQQCFDDDVTLLIFQSFTHEDHSGSSGSSVMYTCSKVATDGDSGEQSLSSCTADIIDQIDGHRSASTIMPSKTQTQQRDYSITTLQHPIPSTTTTTPTVLRHCSNEGRLWPTTPVNTNHTITGGCYNGTVNATRRCGIDGIWDTVYCLVEDWFTDVIDQASMSTEQALVSLTDLITAHRSSSSDGPSTTNSSNITNVSLAQIVSLLDRVLQIQIEHNDENMTSEIFTTAFMETTNHLIDTVGSDVTYDSVTKRGIGSQLLLTLDDLALRVASATKGIINITDTMFLKVLEHENLSFDKLDITGIKVGNDSINIPTELVDGALNVRIGSFHHDNLSHILPPTNHGNRLVSSVISSSVSCQSCPPISELNRNVTIKLHVKDLALMSDSSSITCVFFDIERHEYSLPSGRWNSSGCLTTINYTSSIVTCSCNHLTNFAILLAPNGVQVNETHHQILGIIGLVLIPISILCMIVIILTYTLIRSLWSLRNYVHIMMCVSLCVAQIVFVAGVDRTENMSACSVVAVILQYLFLVCFMWMLMEGVVLYVMLIKVIIKNPKCYAFVFTISCYAIPAMYMSAMVPVGFLFETDDLPDHTHYLYYVRDELTACWLNYDSGFIWSFIAPVITILLINIGFFIMAIVVMVRHLKNKHRTNKESQNKINFRNWLQVSVSLTVVMGLTWLVGVIFNIKDLVFMSYLTTVFIAGQGILLFIILVPLSKQVRDAYFKAWREKNRLFTSTTSSVLPSTVATNGVAHTKRSDGSPDIVQVCS